MARLTKSEHLHFQAEWLAIWRSEGKPQLNPPSDLRCGPLPPYSVSHWGYAQQTYGPASRLSICLGNHDLTRLFGLLGRERISGPSLFPMINLRSGGGRDCDVRLMWLKAFHIHQDAALVLRDVEALRACNEKLSVEMALLHKSVEGRVSPYPRRIYGIATVIGVPS